MINYKKNKYYYMSYKKNIKKLLEKLANSKKS